MSTTPIMPSGSPAAIAAMDPEPICANIFLTPDISDDLALAIHEAAHAVAHCAVGWPFKLVSIIPDEDTLGYVERADVPYPGSELVAVVLCAGTIAEDKLFHAQSWIKRDSFILDWAQIRLELRAKLFPSNPVTSSEELTIINELIRKEGAEKLARVVALTLPFRHPEQTAAVEVELTKWARVANKLVRKFWPQVWKLAQSLLEKKVLTYQEVLKVLK